MYGISPLAYITEADLSDQYIYFTSPVRGSSSSSGVLNLPTRRQIEQINIG